MRRSAGTILMTLAYAAAGTIEWEVVEVRYPDAGSPFPADLVHCYARATTYSYYSSSNFYLDYQDMSDLHNDIIAKTGLGLGNDPVF